MTPEEEFNQEVLWILQEIKKELLATPEGEKIEFSIRHYSGTPSAERQRKLLYKLQEWKALEKIESGDFFADDFLSPPKKYLLLINQQKFDGFCKKWGNIDENPWLPDGSKTIQRNKLIGEQKKKAEIRVKEIRKHFEELNERQKELKESEERIYSRIRKELDVPIQYFKSHEEIIKKISEQLAPLKDALERVGRAQQTVKIFLTPALQRLAPSLKQLEEQIRNFNELYKAPDHSLSEAIISPDLIRVRQGTEMISELREVRKLIEKSAITKDKPIPIKGELKIEGLKEGLEAIAKTKKEEDKNKFPYKLPAGTVWENIIFQFLNDENVFIKVGQHKHYTNYKEMRLVGKGKNPNPSELWTFLKVLALENGEIPIDNLKRETKYKKQKELLSKFLQSYFGINLDPFYPYKPYPPYKHEKSYKIRMTLIPPPQSAKKQNDLNEEDKDDLGIKEDYKQQTPEIYDKDQ